MCNYFLHFCIDYFTNLLPHFIWWHQSCGSPKLWNRWKIQSNVIKVTVRLVNMENEDKWENKKVVKTVIFSFSSMWLFTCWNKILNYNILILMKVNILSEKYGLESSVSKVNLTNGSVYPSLVEEKSLKLCVGPPSQNHFIGWLAPSAFWDGNQHIWDDQNVSLLDMYLSNMERLELKAEMT